MQLQVLMARLAALELDKKMAAVGDRSTLEPERVAETLDLCQQVLSQLSASDVLANAAVVKSDLVPAEEKKDHDKKRNW